MKKILCALLCAVMLGSFAALFAGCGQSAGAGEVNVFCWGDYFAEGQDDLRNVPS